MASERAESDSRLSKSKYYFVKKKVKILFCKKKVKILFYEKKV
jgi:hypothetical protein